MRWPFPVALQRRSSSAALGIGTSQEVAMRRERRARIGEKSEWRIAKRKVGVIPNRMVVVSIHWALV